MIEMAPTFPTPPADKRALEEGTAFTPRFNADGLVTAVVTDAGDGALLMVAHMNAEALQKTLETGIAHFWSRSRKSLWKKGETSGNEISVIDIRTDCDQDAIWIAGRIAGNGVACHTGEKSCFFRRITSNGNGGFHLKPTD